MTAPIEMDTYVALGAIQRQHDHAVHVLWLAGKAKKLSADVMAEDPEIVFHLDGSEAIAEYLNAHDEA